MPTKKSAPKKSPSKKPVTKKVKAKSAPKEKAPLALKSSASQNCKCLKKKTKYYCYHLVQGGWQQASGIGYPSKQMCEKNCCS